MRDQAINIYTTSWCPDCRLAKAFLRSKGLAYREIDIEQNPEATEFVLAHNDGRMRVPTLEFGDKVVGNPPLAQLGKRLGLE